VKVVIRIAFSRAFRWVPESKRVRIVVCLATAGAIAAIGYRSIAIASSSAPPLSKSETANLTPEEREALEAEDSTRREAAAYPVTSSAPDPMDAQWIPGILDSPQTFLAPSEFEVVNLWGGEVNGRWEIVNAGGIPAAPALGDSAPPRAGVYVYTYNLDPNSTGEPQMIGAIAPAQGPLGWARVTSADNGVLTLTVDSGQILHFDSSTLKFF
jgi:hypothetical protein